MGAGGGVAGWLSGSRGREWGRWWLYLILPICDDDAGVRQGPEDVDVQAFVADPAVERFDIAVAPRLTRRDERTVKGDHRPSRSSPRRPARARCRTAAQRGNRVGGQPVQLVDQVIGGDAALDQPAQAFAGVLIHDGHDLDRAPVGGGVELKVHGPHPIRRIGNQRLGPSALAPRRLRRRRCGTRRPSSRHNSLQAFVVDIPAVGTSPMVGAAKPPPGMLFGPLGAATPKRGVRVTRRLAGPCG